MLDRLFHPLRRRHILSRIQVNPLGQMIGIFSTYLLSRGHTRNVTHVYLQAIEHLGTWLRRRSIRVRRMDERVIAEFLDHVPECSCSPPASHDTKTLRASARLLLRCLREQRRVPERVVGNTTPVDCEVDRFDRHLLTTCGLAQNTRTCRRRYVRRFLNHKFGRGTFHARKIGPKDVMEFVASQAATCKPGSAKVITCSLRSYFKYLQLRGLCDTQLVNAVPTIPVWKLASTPKTISVGDLHRFLATFDRSTVGGRRDYAMALCMVDCGLRVCEIADLRLEDIDWRHATLRVPGRKIRRSRLLPLTARGGRAIASYLRSGRPRSSGRGLFCLLKAPWKQVTAFTVRGALRRTYDRSGASPWSGPHSLRHTLAVRLMENGARIKEVADVLGHTSIDTTAMYAKANLQMLKRVARPWPKEVR